MASPCRARIHLAPPPEATVVFTQAPIIRPAAARIAAFVRRIVHDEPTLLAELGSWAFVASWSFSLLVYRTAMLPTPIAQAFERGAYFTMAVIGAILAVIQLSAMVGDHERARALCSYATSIWLGGLAASLFFGDYRVPSGLGYVAMSFLSMLGYWRVKPRVLASFWSRVARVLRGRGA